MKDFIICPLCHNIKVVDTNTGDVFWTDLNCFELSAIRTIQYSELLSSLFLKIGVVEETCKRCSTEYSDN